MMSDLITTDLVDLELTTTDKDATTRRLAGLLAGGGRVTDLEGFLADVRAREAQMPTGIEGGIGIPHARSAFGRSAGGVDYGAPDGPADIIFLIAAPEGSDADHLNILAALARRLVHASFKDALRAVVVPQDVVDLVNKEVLGQ
jgi:PTS system fructose-specific IIA component